MLPSAVRSFTCATVARDARPTRALAGALNHATSSKSQPYLNIKLPDLSTPPPQREVYIPFTSNFRESSRAKADAAPPALPASIREHVTVKHHHAEPASVPKTSNLRALFTDVADDPKDPNAFKNSKSRLPRHVDFEEKSTSTGAEMSKFDDRTLDSDWLAW